MNNCHYKEKMRNTPSKTKADNYLVHGGMYLTYLKKVFPLET